MPKFVDLTEQRFGRLTVIERSSKVTKGRNICWKCICDCGNETIVSGSNLERRKTKSCGCLNKELLESRRRKMLEKYLNNPEARKNNLSIGIKNIYYQPNQGSACYVVKIVRNYNEYRQSFTTLKEAERAKEYVLSRYKKGISNWNAKL
ncbi:hypothetical protein [Lactococcus lactis]|uniref:hypothetical protein n=1 Tax=Lactococcus lactis TaxID=1358 RepID=UPI000BA7D7FA|nr:hypothetical protein [Lactococcus lactis]PAK67841.1 hypothetical protein B8W94_04010 [Lactococcus lactis]PEN17677.1 hypothetical protein CRM88_12750 [Lactococcus lactis]